MRLFPLSYYSYLSKKTVNVTFRVYMMYLFDSIKNITLLVRHKCKLGFLIFMWLTNNGSAWNSYQTGTTTSPFFIPPLLV